MSNDKVFWESVKNNSYRYTTLKTIKHKNDKASNYAAAKEPWKYDPTMWDKIAVKQGKPWRYEVEYEGGYSSRRILYENWKITKIYEPAYVEAKLAEGIEENDNRSC